MSNENLSEFLYNNLNELMKSYWKEKERFEDYVERQAWGRVMLSAARLTYIQREQDITLTIIQKYEEEGE